MATDKQAVQNKTQLTEWEDAINSAICLTLLRFYAIRTGKSVFVSKSCYSTHTQLLWQFQQAAASQNKAQCVSCPQVTQCVLPPVACPQVRQCVLPPVSCPQVTQCVLPPVSCPQVTQCVLPPDRDLWLYAWIPPEGCKAKRNPLQPNGHYMYRQFNINQFSLLPTQCIYVFCVYLRTNSDYFPIQH